MRAVELWGIGPDDVPRAVRCHLPLWISASGSLPAGRETVAPGADSVLLVPIEPSGRTCGLVLIPDGFKGLALLDGARLTAGLHAAGHASELIVNGRRVWLSLVPTADETTYDPALHGEAVHCARTRARITEGERIVVCAGTPEQACGLVYAENAWALRIPCSGCGAPSPAVRWAPPTRPSRASWKRLLEIVRAG